MGNFRNWTWTIPGWRGSADQSGATAIEYALIGAGIAVAIIAALFALGDEIVSVFQDVQSNLESAGN
ncbi:MAG: Flp family type IVb pilin [Alphaproteobacteria bacterium]|nr:Flp family type IVb pilin [Alphaproteobacteria bacterium]MDP6563851.1 Flp family type IVb pilin [Alphaproteobacteria bacterium]MDP6814424.1 Flp family type IVb pilin [Alphaproteobacteria bacterium]